MHSSQRALKFQYQTFGQYESPIAENLVWGNLSNLLNYGSALNFSPIYLLVFKQSIIDAAK
jgi:hypothetical protein